MTIPIKTSKLTFRTFREEQLPGILRLWSEETDWGPLTEATWKSWYQDTPYGSCIIGVAVNSQGGCPRPRCDDALAFGCGRVQTTSLSHFGADFGS